MVILLDSVLADTKFKDYLSKVQVNSKLLRRYLLEQGHLPEYVDKVISNFNCDNELSSKQLN